MTLKLEHYCSFRNEKTPFSSSNSNCYVSTENMLPNKAGITQASSLPSSGSVSVYKVGDILISNIRPYFKKIWLADRNGSCSNDVLVLQPNKNRCTSEFLYFLLSEDSFFAYATKTSKGTKMPRGDKKAIMNYSVPEIGIERQK